MSSGIASTMAELLRPELFFTAINKLALSATAYERALQGAKIRADLEEAKKTFSPLFKCCKL